MAGGSDAKRGHMAGRGSAKTWPAAAAQKRGHIGGRRRQQRETCHGERYIIDGQQRETCHGERYIIYMFCVRVDIM